MFFEYDNGSVRFSIVEALNSLVPNASWSAVGYEYESINWDDSEILQPSKEEVLVEIERLHNEYLKQEYRRLRAAEYPPMADYLDGIVKNDQEQIQKYIDACQAVKDKYPKPSV